MGKAREYVHQELGREMTAIGGHYAWVKEGRVSVRGREVLYVVGYGLLDATCCGFGGLAYALVPGYLLEWRCRTNEEGGVISLVEPIQDEGIQKEVRRLIQKREGVQQVDFQSVSVQVRRTFATKSG
ncbi:MAG TPA: hypothetical protein ENN99_14920 [Chloroflexi bacterium]|nr:hypothetical protein [Chloroflexota bacterium]